jgi:hypothetical protein
MTAAQRPEGASQGQSRRNAETRGEPRHGVGDAGRSAKAEGDQRDGTASHRLAVQRREPGGVNADEAASATPARR